LRDDFGIDDVHPIKVALTRDQVNEHKLPPLMVAKETSSNYKRFVAKYGTAAYEVEAMPTKTLQKIVREAIDAVIDREAFNAELDQERQDAASLEAYRRIAKKALNGAEFGEADE
jgi:hypothetical protein